jgi:XTP/dITP diphosphohydrolase
MKEIVFATHNKNKATEVRALLAEHYKVLTLDGIYSARYSGNGDVANYQLVLEKLQDLGNRKAQFRTVISLLQQGKEYFFEGELRGVIRNSPVGSNGFGYDPIFQPEGYTISLAEMSIQQKNDISHRAIAMKKLIAFLSEQSKA